MRHHDGSTIAIIPARRGSVGLPNKNLRSLGGKNLIQIAIDSAIKSQVFDHCFLTTDYDESEIGIIDKRVTFIKRSADAATKQATANDVLRDVFHKISPRILELNPTIVYLQPTSIFRNFMHIIDSVRLFRETEGRPVVSVCSHPAQFEKFLVLKETGLLESATDEILLTMNRTSVNSFLYPNGAIYVFKYSEFISRGTFPIHSSRAFMMDWVSSLDIDSEDDFLSAEKIWRIQSEQF